MNVSITILIMFSLVLKCKMIEVYDDIQCYMWNSGFISGF